MAWDDGDGQRVDCFKSGLDQFHADEACPWVLAVMMTRWSLHGQTNISLNRKCWAGQQLRGAAVLMPHCCSFPQEHLAPRF